jgi:hypothetical protein
MTLEEIAARFKGTPYEDAMAELCQHVSTMQAAVNWVHAEECKRKADQEEMLDASDRSKTNQSNQKNARQSH